MVRIVGGRYRGKQLSVPKGDKVRPTTDRVREALFNILDHRFDQPYLSARVLDLFAGAGTLGLESLSRGASHVCFVEKDGTNAANLRKNLRGIAGDAQVIEKDVTRVLRDACKIPYELVFMDPPYADGLLQPCLDALAAKSWLSPQGLVCVEQPSGHPVLESVEFKELFSRRYGRTTISVLSLRSD